MIRLSDTEWTLMNRLWEGEATVMELTRELGEAQDWSKSTIITRLGRLEKKGAVTYREEGRTKHFYPLIDRDKAAVQETEGFLNKVYQGSIAMMLNAMAGTRGLKEGDIRELRQLLDQWEAEESAREQKM